MFNLERVNSCENRGKSGSPKLSTSDLISSKDIEAGGLSGTDLKGTYMAGKGAFGMAGNFGFLGLPFFLGFGDRLASKGFEPCQVVFSSSETRANAGEWRGYTESLAFDRCNRNRFL